MSDRKLSLYVWPKFMPDYSAGLAFAIAETEEQAREMVSFVKGFTPEDWGVCLVYAMDHPIAYAVSGGM
jgi:hypothetical protein